MQINWTTVQKKIDDLLPADYNPRQMTEDQANQLEKSLKKFGLAEIPAVNVDGTILAGHQRMAMLKKLGKGGELIDVRIPNRQLTDEEAKEYNLRSNKNTGEWDFDKLLSMDEELLKDVGFDEAFFDNLLNKDDKTAEEDDFEQPDTETLKTDIKLGDIIEIGEHRLMCGDSTSEEQVLKLMDGEKAIMAHNDPPYGMKKENDGVLNDNLNYDDLLEFNKKWIGAQLNALDPVGSWYCWGIDEPLMDIYSGILKPLAKQNKLTFRNLITWDKGHGQGQMAEERRSYATADEKCLFIMMGVQGFNTNSNNYFEGWEPVRKYLADELKKAGLTVADVIKATGKTTASHYFTKSQWHFPTEEHYKTMQGMGAFHKEYEAFHKEYEALKKEYYSTRAYFNNTHDNFNNVWHFARTAGEEREQTGGHATPKPIQLCSRAIMCSSQDGDIVSDLFLGSGSTMVAAHQLGRKCYGMELDPKYCQVIVNRMRSLDDTLTVKINNKVV